LKAARRLILPALVAGPAVMWMIGLFVIGWPGFTRFSLTPEAFLTGAAMVAAVLLVFGWPAGALIARVPTPAPVRILLLVAAGAAGGGLLTILFGGGPEGMLAGAVTAAIWAAFNSDLVAGGATRGAA
jgi:hypothetical protein